MKYIFVMDQFKTGGVESVFQNIARATKRQLYLYPIHADFDSHLIDSLPSNVVLLNKTSDFKRNMVGLLKVIHNSYLLKKKFQHKDVTAINFSDTLTSLAAAHVISGSKTVSWFHCNPNSLKKSKSFTLYEKLISECECLVFLCADQMMEWHKIKKSNNKKQKEVICNNFLDEKKIDSLINEPVEVNKNYFFMAARIDERSKDFITLFKAYSMLPEEIKNKYDLVIAGEGNDINKVVAYTYDLNINDNVKFIGNTINPYKWMKNSALYIHSSKSEGYSMVVLEALYCGCTVVSADCKAGPSFLLDSGKYGYLFEPKNAGNLKETIIHALNNKIDFHISRNRATDICKEGRAQIRRFLNDSK